MDNKIDSIFAAMCLVEILYDKGLINKETLVAVREKMKNENPHNSQVV